jgi:hypothetical protein
MVGLSRTLGAALLAGALLVTLTGCKKPEGPAERAGQEIDKAVDRAGQQVEKAGESIQDAARGEKK